jgi:hypothetical protein
MAGTIVSDTIQDGAGASTSTTNIINGSAKAWAKFNGNGSISSNASYNASSIVRNSTGNYTVNFTTAFSDTLYATTGCISYDLTTGTGTTILRLLSQTTTAVSVMSVSSAGAANDSQYIAISCFR